MSNVVAIGRTSLETYDEGSRRADGTVVYGRLVVRGHVVWLDMVSAHQLFLELTNLRATLVQASHVLLDADRKGPATQAEVTLRAMLADVDIY